MKPGDAAQAEALTREGAQVIATDVTDAPGCRRLDVTSDHEWAALTAELRESYGRRQRHRAGCWASSTSPL